MKIAELFKHMIDLLDQEEQATPQELESSVDLTVMVPPLQQKMELHKKAHGLDNVYDQANDVEPDELVVIKRNAGIASITTPDEDEPFDG